MCYYEKTLLTCYKTLNCVAEQIENMIKNKAFSSMYNYENAKKQMDRLIELNEKRLDLLELKAEMDEILLSLDENDKKLLSYRFFGEKAQEDFDTTSRNYFRKQIKALNHFSHCLEKHGLTEEWFMKKYYCIAYIKGVYQKMIKEEGKKHVI